MCYIINYTILKTIFNYYGKMENRDGSINRMLVKKAKLGK